MLLLTKSERVQERKKEQGRGGPVVNKTTARKGLHSNVTQVIFCCIFNSFAPSVRPARLLCPTLCAQVSRLSPCPPLHHSLMSRCCDQWPTGQLNRLLAVWSVQVLLFRCPCLTRAGSQQGSPRGIYSQTQKQKDKLPFRLLLPGTKISVPMCQLWNPVQPALSPPVL